MNRFSTRERLLVVLAAIALTAFLALTLIVLPLRRQSARLAAEEKSLQQQVTEAEMMYRSLPRVKEEILELKTQIAALSRREENPTPEVVREIERLTTEAGVQLTSVRPAEPGYADDCTRFPTTFEVQSSFSSIARMLYDLERPPHSLWVEGAELNLDREANMLRAVITVSVYSCKPEGEAGDEAG